MVVHEAFAVKFASSRFLSCKKDCDSPCSFWLIYWREQTLPRRDMTSKINFTFWLIASSLTFIEEASCVCFSFSSFVASVFTDLQENRKSENNRKEMNQFFNGIHDEPLLGFEDVQLFRFVHGFSSWISFFKKEQEKRVKSISRLLLKV